MKLKTALILCAGFGKRLMPLTESTPKPLLKFNKITLLENSLNLLSELGIKKVLINTYHLGDKIKNFISDNNYSFKIEVYEDGKEILNTGGGINNLIKNSGEENFLVLNPDTLWNKNYVPIIDKMEELYFSQKNLNILLLASKEKSFDKNLVGDFQLKNSHILRGNNNFVYTGCQIINKSVFKNITKKIFSINEIWNQLIFEKKLKGFESNLKFYHVTDLSIYKKLLELDKVF